MACSGPSTPARACACAAGWRGGASTASISPSSTSATTPGIVQCVIDGTVDVRSEWVVSVRGTVRLRPEGTVNPGLDTGEVEVGDCTVEVLNEAEPPPFAVDDRAEADEPVRLRYRYVDLRRPRMQRNLRLRSRVNAAIRTAMVRQGFVEIETPLLWAPTPEGSREFSVPARLHHGSFYALPQSPQLAKQLLMVGGFDRYFQIPRCLRDEDLRADRQFEFSQLDMECSFASQDDVMGFVSEAVLDAAEAATGERPPAITRMTWSDALDRFGTDKPDLRVGMELVDLSGVFEKTKVNALSGPVVKAILVPGAASSPRSRLDEMTERVKASGAAGLAWFRVVDGESGAGLDGPLARHLDQAERDGVVERTGAGPGDLVLAVSDEHATACRALGALRTAIASPPVGQGPHRYVWVVDFPMFEGYGADGHPQPAHHPFTMPYPEDLPLLASDPMAVRSQAYDLVLNGWELGSGSVRIHRSGIQSQVFDALGIEPDEAEARFGFLLGRLPLRCAAARRLRLRCRPPGGDPGGRGEHPRGDRVPEDAVGLRPVDRGPDAAARGQPGRAGHPGGRAAGSRRRRVAEPLAELTTAAAGR